MARVREKKIKVKLKCQRCNCSYPITDWHTSTATAGGSLSHRLPYVRGITVKCPGCGYAQSSHRCSRTMLVNGRETEGYYIT